MRRHEILWQCESLRSTEHAVLAPLTDGWQISGQTVVPIGDLPGHIDYTVTADKEWATQLASITVHGPRAAAYEIRQDNGSWRVNGKDRPDLNGCVDIDLGWTPATNTLPIRRLQLDLGETATITAAWFRFPEMAIEANDQQYIRTDDRVWRYVSGPYDFQLHVDEHGRVVKYGDDLWHAVAVT